MTLIVPTLSKIELLKLMTGLIEPEDFSLDLFSNNVTPNINTTKYNFNNPGGTYLPKTLFKINWYFLTNQEPPTIAHPPQSFVFQSWTGTIFGYYVSLKSSGKLLWVEQLEIPFVVVGDGDFISIFPTLTLDD